MSKIGSLSRVRAGFTLLELLIVILLISIFYYLVSASFMQDKKRDAITLDINNIRNYPLDKIPQNGAELICIDECQECYIHPLNSFKLTQIKSSLPKKLKAYIINSDNEAIEIDFGRYHDRAICLRFKYYPNRSTSQMILFDDNQYYYLPSFFGKIESFSSLSDAIKRYRWIEGKFTDKSDYY